MEKSASERVIGYSEPVEMDSEWVGTEDLYIIGPSNSFDPSHQFKSQISGIYGVQEFIWTGVLEPGPLSFRRKDGQQVPVPADSNHGFTLVGKAKDLFRVENALVVLSETGDQAYAYIQNDSTLVYVGDDKPHTLFVRIYDNASGENNDHWLALSIK